jgi:hypothetical protein
MKSTARRVEPTSPIDRSTYRTLEGWALGTLFEQGAVLECDDHGHRRDKADPDAWTRAREEARKYPFPGNSAAVSVAAIDDVMASIGDSCPDCG